MRFVWLGLRRDAFTCVGWQIALCDLIWQVALRRWVHVATDLIMSLRRVSGET